MTVSAWVLVPLVAYLLVLVGLGWWSRRESNLDGYYVAGKSLPSWVVAFSSNATGESGWLLLGLTGMGYLVGVHALWVVVGEVLGVTFGWLLVAGPFKVLTDRYRAITVPDFLEERFDDRAQLIRKVSVVILLSMAATYCSAQLVASGKAFSSFLGMTYTTGVIVGALVTFFYTTVGGFKAVAYSDLVQGVLMLLALIVLPIVGFQAAGGWGAVMSSLAAADPALLRPMGGYGLTYEGVLAVLSMVTIGLAFLGVPQLLVRFMAARDVKEIRRGGLIATLCITIFDLGAVLAGIAGRALFPALDDQETVMPMLAEELFPAIFTGIFLVVVLGAIMSTVDSLLIMASSAVVRDLVQKVLHPEIDEKKLAVWGRITTFAVGLVALPFALREAQILFWFVLFAWSGLGAAFTPVVLLALFWKRTTRNGALAGMVAGFVVTVAWVVFFKAGYYDLYEMIPGFLAGLVVAVLVSLLGEPPANAEADLALVERELAQ